MSEPQTIEVPIQGMDCVECTRHVQRAIADLPGVESVDVLLATEKAMVRLDPARVDMPHIRQAVEGAGYAVPDGEGGEEERKLVDFTRPILALLGVIFGVVLFVVVVGEWLGLFEAATEQVPWYIGLAIVIVIGFPVFRNVARATLRGQVIAHTLMVLGVLAALVIGQWVTAAVVAFFMRVGDFTERFTTERARRAVKDMTAMAPQTARVEREGQEIELPVEQVALGERVVVRPGEVIPVDGEVIAGHAAVDQATITGESMPVEAGPGFQVYAATTIQHGSLRIKTTQVGVDTTFGRVIKLVEEAEAHRSDVQRVADRFSTYFLPVVAGVAALTFLLRRDPLATAAVLVVACSCAFALATPIAMLASIGAGAKRGLMFKGGKYIELLAGADVLLIDKTGTLTLGKPQITDIYDFRTLSGFSVRALGQSEIHDPVPEILRLAASAEKYSEHPLAGAVREAARIQHLELSEPHDFQALPGVGVRAIVGGQRVQVGSRRTLENENVGQVAYMPKESDPETGDVGQVAYLPPSPPGSDPENAGQIASLPPSLPGSDTENVGQVAYLSTENIEQVTNLFYKLESQGKTLLFVRIDDQPAGLLAASDTLRPEVPDAIQELRELGIRHIELLTGDNQRTASALAEKLGVEYRAELLPQDKIDIVKDYQSQGRTVVMVGDGVNDAPALAQADVGIAMGAAGSGVAIEAAHVALMREDWLLVPEAIRISRRTMRVVKTNIGFTAGYNLVGLTLAAFGILSPILAAAAQSLPDLGILANSSRLLRQK